MSVQQPPEAADNPQPLPHAQRQRQVESLADAYLERLLAGETPDRQKWLAEHADLADLLGPRLELVELMHRIAQARRSVQRQPAECVRRIKCPHCGNAIQLVEPTGGEVTCGGCGSSFHVDPGATATYSSADLPQSIGKFAVLEQLGRGAFGTVYKARDPQLQRLVAVKVPRTGSFATEQEEERFLREARAAAQLNHPGIVPVLEIAHDRGVPYIVSAYIEGLTLADVLSARRPGFREAAEMIAAIADALDYAHRQKIVHRDIKPSNLLLDAAGRPHVTDFGLARRGEPEITLTLDGQILGTPAYMSPEQAAGDQQHVDARSDVYSLGVVLYELLSGELPFRGNQRMLLHQVIHDEPRPPRSLNDRIPRDLETICLKAMAKSSARRYASAQEMADDLRRFLNGEAIRARRVGRAEKLARWARRNPVVASLTAAVALLLLTATTVAISFALYQRQANRELADEKAKEERSRREAELQAASAAVDLDLKHCEDGEIEYGVLRLARTLGKLPSHATELRQCVEMNLLAWAQEIRPLGPSFQHDGAETRWELSPDGLTVLTGGADGTARLWDAFSGEVRATLRGHRGEITSVAFSKNGRVAMTVGADRTVRLWDASKGQARAMTAVHPKRIYRALFSPDERRLLTICHDDPGDRSISTVSLWDTDTGKRISVLADHEGHVFDAAFSPDGQTVLTGGADKTARLWSADNGCASGSILRHVGSVLSVAFSPEGDVVATLSSKATPPGMWSNQVRWRDISQARQIGPPCTLHGSSLRCIYRDVAASDMDVMGTHFGELCVQGMETAIDHSRDSSQQKCRADEVSLFDGDGRAYDRRSGKGRAAPSGRKFSAELARFATGGRFIDLEQGLMDLATEKTIGKRPDYRRSGISYVSGLRTFFALEWSKFPPSTRIAFLVPLSSEPLDAEIARLFAEIVTCHELDPAGTTRPLKEIEWNERRGKLLGRLDEHSAPSMIRRVASDPWFWLRRQADRADAKNAREEEIKYLDRLLAVEPTWQNYNWRALSNHNLERNAAVAQDWLEAAKRAGEGYWHHRVRSSSGVILLVPHVAEKLILEPKKCTAEYQLGLQLAEAISRASPENRGYRVCHAIALYRVGRYADALSRLEPLQREWQKIVVTRVGEFFLMGPRALLLYQMFPLIEDDRDMVQAMAFLAMTHHRLGHQNRARVVLADLRKLGAMHRSNMIESTPVRSFDYYEDALREAETLIEGKPRPDK